MVSCESSGSSALVGRWVRGYENSLFEFLSDGTGVITPKGHQGNAITWKAENGRLYITHKSEVVSMSYKLQGSVLTLTADDGKITKYAKCNKDCKEAAEKYVKTEIAAMKAKVKKGSYTDTRDKKTYKTVKIGEQTWMAENLNYEASDSYCYDNKPENCQKYGGLYNWETAETACPSGWHLPNKEEWQVLVDFAGGSEIAGTTLKATSGWKDNGNGEDAIGFAALPSGYVNSYGSFEKVGELGYWWMFGNRGVSLASILSNSSKEYSYISSSRYLDGKAVSVRCVQD